MKAMKPNSIDAIVTDPPYGLEFMGKEWDKLRNTWEAEKGRYHNDTTFIARGDRIRYQAGLEAQKWHSQWLTEAYQVLKPGASILVMGGTRTFHRLACAIEDTGFIIKDTLMWVYGSGFPKAQEVSVLVDSKILGISTKEVNEKRKIIGKGKYYNRQPKGLKSCNVTNFKDSIGMKYGENSFITQPLTPQGEHWDGFKIGGIKPAYEPILWAVKPPEGSYVNNVLKWGVGAVNVDECRISVDGDISNARFNAEKHKLTSKGSGASFVWNKPLGKNNEFVTKGRFPANVILDEEAGRLLDEQSKNLHKAGNVNPSFSKTKSWKQSNELREITFFKDSGGASRFFYCAKASRSERNLGLEEIKKTTEHTTMEGKHINQVNHNCSNGAKRTGIRQSVKNNHPTVKPIKLFEWLIKLVTREGQIILDPFIGSGTTAISAHNTGRKCIGIEREDDYLTIARKRVEYWRKQPKQKELRT